MPAALTIGLAVLLVVVCGLWLRQTRALARRNARLAGDLQKVTEQLEQSLAADRAREELLLESMSEGVALLDHDHRVQFVNHSLAAWFNIPPAARGRSIIETFRLHQLAELVERIGTLGHVEGVEISLPTFEDRCFEVSGATFAGREGEQIILVFHELTRLKQLENTRQEFVANVSHELRTPLSLIKGYVETLLGGAKNDPAIADRFLQIIDKHVKRLTFLIEDLLAISQLESGKIAMNLQPLSLAAAVARCCEDLSQRLQEKNITVEQAVPAGLIVLADADRLQQVLCNLLDNAIKYGRPEGRVVVSAHWANEKKCELSVNDNGPGIPPDALSRIFERFYRVDRARARDTGGTGLGLAIVKHIVQAHGGEVWAKSAPAKGATFLFTLPLAPATGPLDNQIINSVLPAKHEIGLPAKHAKERENQR